MKKLILTIALILILQCTVFASSFKGEVKGQVRVNNKPCSTAQVVLINEDMQAIKQTTNNQGYYSFKKLPRGNYLITVTVDNKFFIKYKLIQ